MGMLRGRDACVNVGMLSALGSAAYAVVLPFMYWALPVWEGGRRRQYIHKLTGVHGCARDGYRVDDQHVAQVRGVGAGIVVQRRDVQVGRGIASGKHMQCVRRCHKLVMQRL